MILRHYFVLKPLKNIGASQWSAIFSEPWFAYPVQKIHLKILFNKFVLNFLKTFCIISLHIAFKIMQKIIDLYLIKFLANRTPFQKSVIFAYFLPPEKLPSSEK